MGTSIKQEYWKFGLAAYSHGCSLLLVTRRAVRAVITHAIIVINKLLSCWQPVELSTFMTYKPYLHVLTSITQIFNNVKLQGYDK